MLIALFCVIVYNPRYRDFISKDLYPIGNSAYLALFNIEGFIGAYKGSYSPKGYGVMVKALACHAEGQGSILLARGGLVSCAIGSH